MSKPLVLSAAQRGSSMIEILVSVLVLSIGLLGVASLQAVGLKNNNSAYLRTQANVLASDIMDRMRVNRTAATDSDYDVAIGTATVSGSSIAATDINEWKLSLSNQLPAGDGSVACDADAVCTVTIQWTDAQQNGDLGATSIVVVTRL